MKKQLFAVTFALAISLFVSAGETCAQSEAFRFHVPFDFSANNKTLPAGTYTVNPATDSRMVWRVQGASNKPVAILMAGHLTGADESNLGLRFRRFGDQYFLIGFKTHSFQIAMPTSGVEKNLRAANKLAKSDVVIVETKKSNGGDDGK